MFIKQRKLVTGTEGLIAEPSFPPGENPVFPVNLLSTRALWPTANPYTIYITIG